MNVKIAKWTERRTDGMTNKQVMYQTHNYVSKWYGLSIK